MESGYTSGPWALDSEIGARNADPKAARYVWPSAKAGEAVPKDFRAICTVWAESAVDRNLDANARLIARAPQIAEALRRLLNSPDLNLEELEQETQDAIDEAEEALSGLGLLP